MEFVAARTLSPLAPGVWRSLVAHSLWERGAVGSNPATPTQTPPPRLSEAEHGSVSRSRAGHGDRGSDYCVARTSARSSPKSGRQ
jgi:hypothetical protein